jgi:ribosomal-protein-alanine N-acetyltransferase
VDDEGARRLIADDEWFDGALVRLRLVTMRDCTERYAAWLNDPLVTKYLETRWEPQTLESIRAFVREQRARHDSYLLAIVERRSGSHVGNLKLGPIHPRHGYADVSYFIGERDAWGRGLATDAIQVATAIGFERLGLHRLQAGAYAGNVASARALLRAGFRPEGVLRAQLLGPDGHEDHRWFGLLRSEWDPVRDVADYIAG